MTLNGPPFEVSTPIIIMTLSQVFATTELSVRDPRSCHLRMIWGPRPTTNGHSHWTPVPEKGGNEVEESDLEIGSQANLHQTSGFVFPRKSMMLFLHF